MVNPESVRDAYRGIAQLFNEGVGGVLCLPGSALRVGLDLEDLKNDVRQQLDALYKKMDLLDQGAVRLKHFANKKATEGLAPVTSSDLTLTRRMDVNKTTTDSQTITTPKGTLLPLLLLKGKPYLMVAHRLVWFRETNPSWTIETEFKELVAGPPAEAYATAKATIKDEAGRVISTGHKTEYEQQFPDFREKAETGAVGRALAHCGFGTQFAPDLDEGERIVDSPIERPKSSAGITKEITQKIYDLSAELGINPQEMVSTIQTNYGKPALKDLNMMEAQGLLKWLTSKAAGKK